MSILTGRELTLIQHQWKHVGNAMWIRDGGAERGGIGPVPTSRALQIEDAEFDARERHLSRQRDEFNANTNERIQRVVKDYERLGPQAFADQHAGAEHAYANRPDEGGPDDGG